MQFDEILLSLWVIMMNLFVSHVGIVFYGYHCTVILGIMVLLYTDISILAVNILDIYEVIWIQWFLP